MHYIGHGLELPKHDDVKGWEMFYDQVTEPRYGMNRENKHWEQCRLRLRPGGAKERERRRKIGCQSMGWSRGGMMFLRVAWIWAFSVGARQVGGMREDAVLLCGYWSVRNWT